MFQGSGALTLPDIFDVLTRKVTFKDIYVHTSHWLEYDQRFAGTIRQLISKSPK